MIKSMRWALFPLALALAAGVALWTPLGAAAQPIDTSVTPQLTRLHDALHLTGPQEPSWTVYKRAIAPNADVEARHKATDDMLPSLPTPRRIALIAATMAADEADFRRQGAAVTAFYDQLTPAQRRTFDAETLPARGLPR
jgi:hypothetical protein